MATAAVRSVDIIESAVLNGPSTPQQRQRLLALYAVFLPPGATTEEIAREFVNDVRGYIIKRLQRAEAMAVARTAEDQVLIDYPEQP